ncbi:hypothetical protein D3C72_2284500 [compost metagenome]
MAAPCNKAATARKPSIACPLASSIARSRPKSAGAKAYAPWDSATISGTTRRLSSRANSVCAISGGKDVALPMPEPNKITPSHTAHVWSAASISVSEPKICTA